jgi:hypothetical protein
MQQSVNLASLLSLFSQSPLTVGFMPIHRATAPGTWARSGGSSGWHNAVITSSPPVWILSSRRQRRLAGPLHQLNCNLSHYYYHSLPEVRGVAEIFGTGYRVLDHHPAFGTFQLLDWCTLWNLVVISAVSLLMLVIIVTLIAVPRKRSLLMIPFNWRILAFKPSQQVRLYRLLLKWKLARSECDGLRVCNLIYWLSQQEQSRIPLGKP